MTNDTDPRTYLAGIKERADAATAGPWEVSTGMADQAIVFMPDGYSFKINGHPDSKFVAHSRTDLPRVAAALSAVLDLHVRIVIPEARGEETYCLPCTERWPCKTYAVITDAFEGSL